MDDFDPEMFPDTVTVVPPDPGAEARGDAAPAYAGEPTYSGPAYVEAQSLQAARQEGHAVPEGRQLWALFTPTDPGAVVDSRITFGSTVMYAIAPAQQAGQGALWRTWCVDVR
jgi:hypothetical protein